MLNTPGSASERLNAINDMGWEDVGGLHRVRLTECFSSFILVVRRIVEFSPLVLEDV
jgi:hypothetical protein